MGQGPDSATGMPDSATRLPDCATGMLDFELLYLLVPSKFKHLKEYETIDKKIDKTYEIF